MKKTKRVFSCLLAAALALSFAACGKKDGGNGGSDDTETTLQMNQELVALESDKTLKLAYSSADSLNPFNAQSAINQSLSTLLFDPLYYLNTEYDPVAVIAGNAVNSNNLLTVTVKSGVTFTDSTAVSANDVLYSFNKAKASANYSNSLLNFTSAYVKGNDVVFRLANADAYAANCLTFPIVKNSTADSADIPVGSGRYVYSSSDGVLNYNQSNIRGQAPSITSIRLVNVSDSDALVNSLQIGNISYSFQDLSSGSYTRINAAVNDVVLNNLVYIGVNSKNTLLSNPSVVKAISSAVNREAIATSAYQGHAVTNLTPFNPSWSVVKSVDFSSGLLSADKIDETLNAAGLSEKNALGYRVYGNSAVSLRLLVNSGNAFKVEAANLVATQLSAIGINVQVNAVNFTAYTNALAAGDFDLYIGEIRLADNQSLSVFFDGGGAASYGITLENNAVAEAYKQFAAGSMNITDFMNTFNESMPFIPLCNRCGVSANTRELSTQVTSTQGDNFYNIAQWSF